LVLVDAPSAINGFTGPFLLLILGFALIAFIRYGVRAVAFPYPLDYGEGPLLDQVSRLAHYQGIYRADLTRPPYIVANYPPLFPLLQVPFMWLFGPALWYGRLISVVSVLAAALFAGLIIDALTQDRLAALIGGLVLLAIPFPAYWGGFNRVDALALALSLAALFVIARWPAARWSLVVTAVLLTASIYTRQSYALAAPFAAFAWLAGRQPRPAGRRRALQLAAVTGGLCLGLFILLDTLTHGGFFFNVVIANANEYKLAILTSIAADVWALIPYLLAGGLLYLVLGWIFRVRSWWLVGPYLAAAFLSALTVGKIGSYVNYLFELSAALALVVGALLAWQRPRPWLYACILLVLGFQAFLLMDKWPRQSRYHGFTEDRLAESADLAALTQIVHDAPGTVLADEYMGSLVVDGRPLYIQPFELTQLARSGLWDQRPFLQSIADHKFAAIVIYAGPGGWLPRERWSPEMLQAIDRYYSPQPGPGRSATIIYRPRPQ
jgi:hypothetical protein